MCFSLAIKKPRIYDHMLRIFIKLIVQLRVKDFPVLCIIDKDLNFCQKFSKAFTIHRYSF
jgi:hypothetical protein